MSLYKYVSFFLNIQYTNFSESGNMKEIKFLMQYVYIRFHLFPTIDNPTFDYIIFFSLKVSAFYLITKYSMISCIHVMVSINYYHILYVNSTPVVSFSTLEQTFFFLSICRRRNIPTTASVLKAFFFVLMITSII
jgi:hypothetical protein